MDKVRAFMRVLWMQRFWVLSVVGILAAVVCWMMASGALQAEYQTDKAAILAKFSDMEAIRNKPFHGNPNVNATEREQAVKIAQNVQKLWQTLYEKQREQVLYWPESLGPDFIEQIDRLKFDAPISGLMRDRYQNYIQTQFDALVDIVKAQKLAEGATGFGGESGRFTEGAAMATGLPGEDQDYLVQWVDQGSLQAKLTFGRRPTAREVWVRQEDLWVYETLLNVIDDTNKERGATRPDNTAIRIIESLQVGAEAATASAQQPQILMPVAVAGGESPMTEMSPDAYRGEMPGMDGTGDPAAADAALLANRYIDDEGKPIADASAGMGTEYRRLPVRMRLMMDARYIPTVLVECANAPLPIEVQRLRINPEQSGVGFEMAASGSVGEGGRGGYGGESMRSFAGESSYTPGVGTPTADLATVEIHGFVYIYNPPDQEKLAVPGGEDLAATDSTLVR